MLFLGIDVGTQGVRCAAVDEKGTVHAQTDRAFAQLNAAALENYREQLPEDWWEALKAALRELCTRVDASEIAALSLDGTSGTVVPIDTSCQPLCPALMYNDARSKKEASELAELAREHEEKLGYTFNPSYALPKIKWCLNNGIHAARFANQTDYIVGKLSGEYGVTDYSNALKMGYDLVDLRWSEYIGAYGVDVRSLPTVVKNGEYIASVSRAAAEETGLCEGLKIYAGTTDGIASSVAAGLAEPGDWASVLGTTLVVKGITKEIIRSSTGSVYSHRHPQGWWMPGGASNAGGVYLNNRFGKENFEEYNRQIGALLPTGELCYPFDGKGERFPFYAPEMIPFNTVPEDRLKNYAAAMEGVGYVERMIYELLERGGADVSESINTVGGGNKSREWLEIRASILAKPLQLPKYADASVGSAMIAAAGAYFGTLSAAVTNMCVIENTIEPNMAYIGKYNEIYEQFCEMCRPYMGE